MVTKVSLVIQSHESDVRPNDTAVEQASIDRLAGNLDSSVAFRDTPAAARETLGR
jgi:hypothetical protein